MDFIIYFLQKTIGQKIIVGLTGLALCLFILIHMLGNLFILSGPSAYNQYAHSLHEFPLFTFFEIGLLIFFIGHIVLSSLLIIKNKTARGDVSYRESAKGEKKLSLTHRFIWFQAGVLLVFLVLHLMSFKFGPHYETIIDGKPARDIYKLVVESFKQPVYTLGYSFALLILSIHLLRGLPASLKTFGMSRPLYVSFFAGFSWFFALFVLFGFLAPIWYIFIYL